MRTRRQHARWVVKVVVLVVAGLFAFLWLFALVTWAFA
jgi:cytoskeletal protein RodZ